MVCLPCAAAAGPPGIAVAAVGTVGYGVYKSTNPKKKIRKGKKKTRKRGKGKKGGGKQDKFKKGEIVRFITNDGKKQKMKFFKNVSPNKVSLKFPNAKKKYDPILTVNADKVEKLPKRIANTKRRQKTRRAALVRKKRGIKTKSSTKSSTLELLNSNSDSVDNLFKDMKI